MAETQQVIIKEGWTSDMLGQQRPAAATATVIYQPRVGLFGVITSIFIANTGAATAFKLYHHKTGIAWNAGTQIYENPLAANTTFTIFPGVESGLTVRNPGSFAVEATLATLTFTIYGYEFTLPS